ncbi:hypothetical protein BYT27DRAFT_7197105 [Phlegmacium glaucopus]|nr:hypothetical protein BYT27DRAFT_7197105 [Phlegmacium glaucopus]
MLCHFGITLRIPENRLCPLSHRMDDRPNYILWIQDIVHAHDYVLGNPRPRVRGIDMYKANREGSIFFTWERNPKSNFEFTMCNPPFYIDSGNGHQSTFYTEEVVQSASEKDLAPNAVCTGADIEMIFADGEEEGFVGQMVEESEPFQTRCKWYTSMLGKMSSVTTIVENLRKRSIVNYAITQFVQGQTRRWAFGWSFIAMHLPDVIYSAYPFNHCGSSAVPTHATS